MTDPDDETTMPGVRIVESVVPPKRPRVPALAIVYFGKAFVLLVILIWIIISHSHAPIPLGVVTMP